MAGNNTQYIPYSERVEWKDVTPLKIDEGLDTICPIAYSKEYSDTMNYLRAVMQSGEVSERCFELVTNAIELNPGNYTAWLYRIELFQKLHKSPLVDLVWVDEFALGNPKNYQLYHYRQKIVQDIVDNNKLAEYGADITEIDRVSGADSKNLGDGPEFNNLLVQKEFAFCNQQIEEDSKNFHAWAYRQFLVRTFGLWKYELEYVTWKINEDIRNNSAWNQRYYVLFKSDPSSNKLDTQVFVDEINFVVEIMALAPNNESPWMYIQGLLGLHAKELLYTLFYEKINEMAINSPDTLGKSLQSSRFYLKYMMNYYNYKRQLLLGSNNKESAGNGSDAAEIKELSDEIQDICDLLANTVDPTRSKYYKYLKERMCQ